MAKVKASSRDRRVKVTTTVYLETEQMIGLKTLSERTRVPQQVYLREGVDLVLAKYDARLPKARSK